MLGKNLLCVAKQQGHSLQTMLDVYAAWIDGSQEADLETIRRAMKSSPPATRAFTYDPTRPHQSPEFGAGLVLEPRQNGASLTDDYTGYGYSRSARRCLCSNSERSVYPA
jgi:hypothetical protein